MKIPTVWLPYEKAGYSVLSVYSRLIYFQVQAAVFLRLSLEYAVDIYKDICKEIYNDTIWIKQVTGEQSDPRLLPLYLALLPGFCAAAGWGSLSIRLSIGTKISGNIMQWIKWMLLYLPGALLLVLFHSPIFTGYIRRAETLSAEPGVLAYIVAIGLLFATAAAIREITDLLSRICRISGMYSGDINNSELWQNRLILAGSVSYGIIYLAAVRFLDEWTALSYYRAMNLQLLLPILILFGLTHLIRLSGYS